jgi:glycosyltransferase involved in cell wall biosynthesis
MGIKTDKKIKIVFFNRKPRALGNFSIEIYFQLVQNYLKQDFEIINKVMPFESNGFLNRIGNAFYCLFNQGNVNHITGDIHYVAAFLKKSKTILTILDCGMLHETSGLKHKIFKLLWFDFPIKKSKIITAISNATKDDLLDFTNCDSHKIKVIYVCISPEFKQNKKVFNFENPRILQIGTAQNKNIKRLIPALKGIKCTLVIIGKIDTEIKELITQNNIKLELHDRRLSDEEITMEYKKCDILSLVSTIEGFGMPIVEANAVGRVCITGNTTSMPEIAGDAAHIVDPYNINEIHKGFKLLIQNEEYRASLIQNGFENANRFSAESIAKQYGLLYTELVLNN